MFKKSAARSVANWVRKVGTVGTAYGSWVRYMGTMGTVHGCGGTVLLKFVDEKWIKKHFLSS